MEQYLVDSSLILLPVNVAFLRMDCEPCHYVKLSRQYKLEYYKNVPLSLYRNAYNQVGRSYCWWMRKVISDAELTAYFDNSLIEVYFLKSEFGSLAGFFELDCRIPSSVNISYFGLMPHLVGKRIGRSFFSQVLKCAWEKKPNNVRINTCELDHSRALPLYLESGFKCVAHEVELWRIPRSLYLTLPKISKL